MSMSISDYSDDCKASDLFLNPSGKRLNHYDNFFNGATSLAISLPSAEEDSADTCLTSLCKETSNSTSKESLKPSNCVFVGGLPSGVREDKLQASVKALFQTFGTVASARVLKDEQLRPYAFVQYTNHKDYQEAIERGAGKKINGRYIRVEPAKINRSIFINTLDKMTASEVQEYLLPYGPLEQFEITDSNGHFKKNDSSHLKSLKYSNYFICRFILRIDAIKAYIGLTDKPEFAVEWVKNVYESPREQELASPIFDKYSIYVSRLSMNTTEKDLMDRFSQYGEIKELSHITKGTYAFAFIEFTDIDSAIGAVEGENHNIFHGKPIYVQFREISKFLISNEPELAPAPLFSSKGQNGSSFLQNSQNRSQTRHTNRMNSFNSKTAVFSSLRENQDLFSSENNSPRCQFGSNSYSKPKKENYKEGLFEESKPYLHHNYGSKKSRTRSRFDYGNENDSHTGMGYYYVLDDSYQHQPKNSRSRLRY